MGWGKSRGDLRRGGRSSGAAQVVANAGRMVVVGKLECVISQTGAHLLERNRLSIQLVLHDGGTGFDHVLALVLVVTMLVVMLSGHQGTRCGESKSNGIELHCVHVPNTALTMSVILYSCQLAYAPRENEFRTVL